jgi:nucleoside-diphosphate-sugar epimerase
MNIMVLGGCGYIGSVLVPKLLKAGHRVVVIDAQWFGNYLEPHPNLEVIKADIREDFPITCGTIIHLAGVVNDPAGELNPKLTWEINALGTTRLLERAYRAGVKKFIYASSGSVYGISDKERVTEDLPLVPLSEYNKTKMVAERVVLSYTDKMRVIIIRPATVCGFSPRMRLDVMVNSFVMQAVESGTIKFNGGEQYRPNIHIQDMTDLYVWAVERPLYSGIILNAGFENMKIKDIAGLIALESGASIVATETNDPRSYRLDSTRLMECGFTPKYSVEEAVNELTYLNSTGKLTNKPQWYSLAFTPR